MQNGPTQSTALSADAKSFVPTKKCEHFPRYMTSCYPFVQADRVVEFAMNGTECKKTPSPLNPHNFIQYPQLFTSVIRPPGVPYFNAIPNLQSSQPSFQSPFYSQPKLIKKLSIEMQDTKNKNNKKKNIKKSVGIQPSSQPKTLIFRDVGQQTDFNEALSNKTLSEHPSAFYRSSNTLSAPGYRESTTEDSDSGYSSPMHRLQLLRQQQRNVSTSVDFEGFKDNETNEYISTSNKSESQSYANILKKTPVSNEAAGRMQRKRKRRHLAASKEADEELRDITIEQHVIREINHLPIETTRKSRPQKNISLNIADMISALEKASINPIEVSHIKMRHQPNRISNLSYNIIKKKGKEREIPKIKKPSALKRIILKEREEKKRLRLLDDPIHRTRPLPSEPHYSDNEVSEQESEITILPMANTSIDNCEINSSNSSDSDDTPPLTQPQSPISQVSPYIMSPLNTPTLYENDDLQEGRDLASKLSLHSRRFREFVFSAKIYYKWYKHHRTTIERVKDHIAIGYCNQVLDKEIDFACSQLLKTLVMYHDRLFHKDPVKAKMKRRIVLGLREVTKHLRVKKIKCVIISPNLESIESKGGLDETLNHIIQLCTEQGIPFIFALGRKALGRVCGKLVSVSVVGIFSYDGANVCISLHSTPSITPPHPLHIHLLSRIQEQFEKLVELTETARTTYNTLLNQIIEDNRAYHKPPATSTNTTCKSETSVVPMSIAALPSHSMISAGKMSDTYSALRPLTSDLAPFQGHSRNASSCSAISFISSVLSEPTSEAYKHNIYECDVKQSYEITARQELTSKKSNTIAEYYEDKGHEADTEDELLMINTSAEKSSNIIATWIASTHQHITQ